MNKSRKDTEDRKIRRLRIMVDLTKSVILQSLMTRSQAEKIVESLRQTALRMFPGKDSDWEFIYAPRFREIIEELWGRETLH